MKQTEITYGQLDQFLRSIGFAYRPSKNEPPGRVYEHKEAGAIVMMPALPNDDPVLEHHLAAVRLELENFGIAAPPPFAAKLQKAG